jgi:hypothetical protein
MADKKKLPPEQEPKEKLYRLVIKMEFPAESIEFARKVARKAVEEHATLSKALVEDSVVRVVRAKYSSRADRLDEAKRMIDEARGIVEELKDEIQQWYDNLPENLQSGDKGSALEDCVTNLESVEDSLNEAEQNCDSVEFPGMFD